MRLVTLPTMTAAQVLEDRVVLVTGAAHGMGRAHVAELVGKGASVGALDIDEAALRESVSGLGSRVLPLVADVSDDAAVRGAVDELGRQHGRIDALVSNAGVIHAETGLADTEDDEWRRTFAVHVDGALHLTRAGLPWLRRSDAARIVLISSMWAQRGPGFGYAYCAAKGALLSFGRNLAVELGPEGICVNSIAVGSIPTRMAAAYTEEDIARDAEEIPLGRWGRPEEISHMVAFLVSTESSFVTGQTMTVNGGQIIAGF